jgi:hypothetical protein
MGPFIVQARQTSEQSPLESFSLVPLILMLVPFIYIQPDASPEHHVYRNGIPTSAMGWEFDKPAVRFIEVGPTLGMRRDGKRAHNSLNPMCDGYIPASRRWDQVSRGAF